MVGIMKSIFEENNRIACMTRETLSRGGVYAVNVLGSPGAGKTTCLINIINNMKSVKPFVIEGDIETDIDTGLLRSMGVEAYQINTGGACHLDAPMMLAALEKMKPKGPGVLFVENVGNLICPVEFELGERLKMLICSVAEGSDKPYKYPSAFLKADIILLNKCDLKPYVEFDSGFFYEGIKALNNTAPVFEVSGKTGKGFPEVAAWLEEKIRL